MTLLIPAIRNAVGKAVRNVVRNAVRNAVRNTVCYAVGNAIRNAVSSVLIEMTDFRPWNGKHIFNISKRPTESAKVSRPFLKHNKMERMSNGPHWVLLSQSFFGGKKIFNTSKRQTESSDFETSNTLT